MNTTPIFDHIPLKQITPSKTNPRKYFNDAALADLAGIDYDAMRSDAQIAGR